MASDTLVLFNTLPPYLQRRIDRAFDSVASPTQRKPHSQDLGLGGGFIVEDEALMGGGFVPEDNNEPPTHIPMSKIPSALQHLDLPPDDEQVLAVFRNAASGWTSANSGEAAGVVDMDMGMDGEGGVVGRDDWRAVCAVLLEHYREEYEDESEGGQVDEGEMEMEREGSEDQYQKSDASNDNSDDDDEYIEGPAASTSRRRTRNRPTKSPSPSPSISPSPGPKKLTPRQRQATLQAFALFFPSVPSDEIANQKIMIKDVQRAAKLLGEKIKADEMLEMLDAFSTAPDKSISLEDFGRIMVAAKLA